jgi:small-conductance mechanosensitive channel
MAANDTIVGFYKALLGGQMGNIIVGVIILLIGFIIGKIAGRVVRRILHEIDIDKNIKKAGMNFSAERIISSFSSYLIYFIAIVASLEQFGVATSVLRIVLGGIVIFLVVVSLFAVKDFVPNFFSGIYLLKTKMIEEGDIIKVHNLHGTVEQISLTKTKLKVKGNEAVFVPNSVIVKSEVVRSRRNST